MNNNKCSQAARILDGLPINKRFLVNLHSKLAGLFVDFPKQIVGHLCQIQEISSNTFRTISDVGIVVDPGSWDPSSQKIFELAEIIWQKYHT